MATQICRSVTDDTNFPPFPQGECLEPGMKVFLSCAIRALRGSGFSAFIIVKILWWRNLRLWRCRRNRAERCSARMGEAPVPTQTDSSLRDDKTIFDGIED